MCTSRPGGKLLPGMNEEVFEALLFPQMFSSVYLQFGATPSSQSSVLGPHEGAQVVVPCLATRSSWLASPEVHLSGVACVYVPAVDPELCVVWWFVLPLRQQFICLALDMSI